MKTTIGKLKLIIENALSTFKPGDRVEYDGSYGDDIERGTVEDVEEDGLLIVTADNNEPGAGRYREWDADTCRLIERQNRR